MPTPSQRNCLHWNRNDPSVCGTSCRLYRSIQDSFSVSTGHGLGRSFEHDGSGRSPPPDHWRWRRRRRSGQLAASRAGWACATAARSAAHNRAARRYACPTIAASDGSIPHSPCECHPSPPPRGFAPARRSSATSSPWPPSSAISCGVLPADEAALTSPPARTSAANSSACPFRAAS